MNMGPIFAFERYADKMINTGAELKMFTH